MKHVMLDLETFGIAPGSVLRSIGAVLFSLDGKTGTSFYANIDRASCEARGLVVDPGTERWWAEQSKEARAALEVDPQPLDAVASRFHAWFAKTGATHVWSHGAAFDAVLWEVAVRRCRMSAPWKFYNVRDTRTVFDLFGFDIRDIRRDGTYHNALDDARYQVKCVAAALRKGRAPAEEGSLFE